MINKISENSPNKSEKGFSKPDKILTQQAQTGSDISLCKNCNCMTKDIISPLIEDYVYCGKCQAFKFETKQEMKK